MLEKIKAAVTASREFISLAKSMGTAPEIVAGMEKVHATSEDLFNHMSDIVGELDNAIAEVEATVKLIEDALPKRVDGTPAHRPAAEGAQA